MMKKILLFSSIAFALNFSANAQNARQINASDKEFELSYENSGSRTASVTLTVEDTLHYYFNKYYFRVGNTDLSTFPSYRMDGTSLTTFTNISFVGSVFEVPAGEKVLVTGLEAYARRGSAVALTVPIRLYLFRLNPATGLPVFPAIDSIFSNALNSGTMATPIIVGGDFTDTANEAARTMTTSFAVGFRNISANSGDYVHLLRTSAVTPTNPVEWTSLHKYSDSYGFLRFNGQFYSTRDFDLFPGFGIGSDYEFMVAPRVQYTAQASQKLPQYVKFTADTITPRDTICGWTSLTFTNTSSRFFEHVQYNLLHFYRKWNLYSAFPPNVASNIFNTDSSITWSFEYFYQGGKDDERLFLPYDNDGTITASCGFIHSNPECFPSNQFRGRLKKMGAMGKGSRLAFDENFLVCMRNCNDAVGLPVSRTLADIKIYPNPAVNGRSVITGLQGYNTIRVFNLLGQNVLTKITANNMEELDLSTLPKGTYIVKIADADNKEKTSKIVNDY